LSCRYAAEILIIRSSDHSIVRPFVHPNNLCPAVMLPKFRSFVRSIIRSFIVHLWSLFIVLPDNLCPAVMLSKFRSFVHPIIRSFVRSFIVPIHRSSFVHSSYSSFIVRSYDYSPSLFTITIHHYYSQTLFTIVTIHHRYCSSMISSNFFVVTIHHYYSSLLFID
jgi:hypothetical protein